MIDLDNLVSIKDQGEGDYLLTYTKESRFAKKDNEECLDRTQES